MKGLTVLNKHGWFNDPSLGEIPNQLVDIINSFKGMDGITITALPNRELESSEYGACRFSINTKNILFRVAKTTPTKIGQFVTCWKRPLNETMPIDEEDGIDYYIIAAFDEEHHGFFLLDRKTLIQRKIMTKGNIDGKRGFRVYPPWTNPTAKQAVNTQKWQVANFLDLDEAAEVLAGKF